MKDIEENKSVIDGVNVEKLIELIISGDTLIGRIVNILYEYNEYTDYLTLEELKDYIKIGGEKSNKELISCIDSGGSFRAFYGKLWNYKDNKISLNENIRNYIDEWEISTILKRLESV